MTADLLEIESDASGNFIFVAMNASCHINLTVVGTRDNEIANYNFTPDKDGIEKAKKVIAAIQQWIEYVD